MRRSLLLVLTFVAGLAARDASAQLATPPVELGVDVSATLLPDRRGVQWGPRVVVNLDTRNSVQFTVGLQKLSSWEDLVQTGTDLYLAAYRRLVHAAGRLRVVATIGGGLQRTVIFVPATTFGNPPVTFPSSRGVEVLPAFTTGAAIDFRLGDHAAVVIEPSFMLTDRLGGRLSAGLVVPLGSYPSQRDRPGSSVPWAKLDPGDRAWITTGDGREVDGEVVGRSPASLTLRTQTAVVSFTPDEVRAIDTTDPVRNGTVLGAVIGGLGAVVPSVMITYVACGLEEDCSVGEALWINAVLVGMGAGIGAATGALADSLRERRVPLYRCAGGTSVTAAPIVDGRRLGGGVVIRW